MLRLPSLSLPIYGGMARQSPQEAMPPNWNGSYMLQRLVAASLRFIAAAGVRADDWIDPWPELIQGLRQQLMAILPSRRMKIRLQHTATQQQKRVTALREGVVHRMMAQQFRTAARRSEGRVGDRS